MALTPGASEGQWHSLDGHQPGSVTQELQQVHRGHQGTPKGSSPTQARPVQERHAQLQQMGESWLILKVELFQDNI